MNIAELLPELSKGFLNLTWGNIVMIAAALVLIYLAVFKEIEPVLLLPIGFGCLLANIPLGGMTAVEGMMGVLYDAGIRTELFPLLIFVGVGAMIDFSPLLSQPKMALLGAAGQFGIYRNVDPGDPDWFPAKPGCLDRNHRRHRWTNIHLCCHQARA